MQGCRMNTYSHTSPSDGVAIQVAGLEKAYGDRKAVRGIDLHVERGEIFAFLGPNGAGKTTTVEILEGFRSRESGSVSVLGVDPAKAGRPWRDRIGIVLQESPPDPGLTVREALTLYAGYYSAPRTVGETLELVGLTESANVQASSLSGGQQRRLDVGLALIGDPDLIFLDEPTTGFDPAARRAAWSVIDDLRALGKTIFLTTHYMDEAERLADHIAVIVDGQIVAEGSPATLGGRDRMGVTITFRKTHARSELPDDINVRASSTQSGLVTLESGDPLRDLEVITTWTRSTDAAIESLEVRQPTLEDIYLRLTSRAEAQPC
jgi:ABC-2 type transport system ATP-binding protein